MSGLPEGWAACTVADVADSEKSSITDGPFGSALKSDHYTEEGIRVIRLGNIGYREFIPHDLVFIDGARAEELRKHEAIGGDLVTAALGEPLGRTCIVPEGFGPSIVKADCFRMRVSKHVENRLVSDWLNSPEVLQSFSDRSQGIGRVRINLGIFRSTPLALPPLTEQRRIVAKIDRLSARSKRAREELDRTLKLISTFKRHLLRSMFIPLHQEHISRMVKMSDVCTTVQSGGTPKNGFLSKGVPFLKVYNIVDDKVDFTYKPQFISREVHSSESKKSICHPGDVLMNIVGPPLGKIAIVPRALEECNINQAICVFRPSTKLSSEFLYYFLRSGISIDSVFGRTKGIVGQVNISLSQCRAFDIPLISADLQAEIVRRIEHAFAVIDRLAAEAMSARKLLDRLDQAVLAKAFRGELVPQDPNDEPASVLLERIRAERAAAPAPKRGRRPKATKA